MLTLPEMRWAYLVLVSINIAKQQHVAKPLFAAFFESAALGELICVFEGSEQSVPPSDVAKVVFVDIKLMMD